MRIKKWEVVAMAASFFIPMATGLDRPITAALTAANMPILSCPHAKKPYFMLER